MSATFISDEGETVARQVQQFQKHLSEEEVAQIIVAYQGGKTRMLSPVNTVATASGTAHYRALRARRFHQGHSQSVRGQRGYDQPAFA